MAQEIIQNYQKNLKTKTKPFLINGDNKETLSLLHGMGILEKDGIKLDELLARYELQGQGTLFWNRYFVKGKKPTAGTDNLVRDFITQTLRESGDEIIKCINFQDKFEDIALSMEEAREEKLGKEDKKNLLRQKCVEIFLDGNFSAFLTKKIKDEWNDKLKNLL